MKADNSELLTMKTNNGKEFCSRQRSKVDRKKEAEAEEGCFDTMKE